MRYMTLIVCAAACMAMPDVALAQASISVEEMNKRLSQEYWRGFESQVKRYYHLKKKGPSSVTTGRHFEVKCWEDGELRVDEKSAFIAGYGSGFFEILLSNGQFMFIHEGGGLCVLKEQLGPTLPQMP